MDSKGPFNKKSPPPLLDFRPTQIDLDILRVLKGGKEVTQTELARSIGTNQPRVSIRMKRLRMYGYVARGNSGFALNKPWPEIAKLIKAAGKDV